MCLDLECLCGERCWNAAEVGVAGAAKRQMPRARSQILRGNLQMSPVSPQMSPEISQMSRGNAPSRPCSAPALHVSAPNHRPGREDFQQRSDELPKAQNYPLLIATLKRIENRVTRLESNRPHFSTRNKIAISRCTISGAIMPRFVRHFGAVSDLSRTVFSPNYTRNKTSSRLKSTIVTAMATAAYTHDIPKINAMYPQ